MEISVQNEEELANIINLGHGLRRVAHTYHNDYSSRSHTMLFLHNRRVDRDGNVQRSKLCLVDLAGSEKVSKTGATGDTLEEAKKINLSLSCLGNVIHSLTSGADHIPYRDSKLTRILKDSLCGHHKTSIITTCSLNKEDRTETISTMKFAIRAKRIKNKQHLSILPKDNNGSQESLIEVIEKLRK
jgi:kinesin family protein 5